MHAVLGLETTCDETAAAVVRLRPDGSGEILADEVMSQIAAHAAYGGVVPEIAARAHVEVLDGLIARALRRRASSPGDSTASPPRRGRGSSAACWSGSAAAKGVALAAGKPFLAVNHLEAHALIPRLDGRLAFPYLLLLASGGHTQILAVEGVGDYVRLGATMDDAIGEAFDKTAKLLGLAYPGGPAVEAAAPRRRSRALRAAAPAARPAQRRLLAVGPEDRGAPRGDGGRAAEAARRRRSLRLVPGGGGGRDRGPAARGAWRSIASAAEGEALVLAGGVAANAASGRRWRASPSKAGCRWSRRRRSCAPTTAR